MTKGKIIGLDSKRNMGVLQGPDRELVLFDSTVLMETELNDLSVGDEVEFEAVNIGGIQRGTSVKQPQVRTGFRNAPWKKGIVSSKLVRRGRIRNVPDNEVVVRFGSNVVNPPEDWDSLVEDKTLVWYQDEAVAGNLEATIVEKC